MTGLSTNDLGRDLIEVARNLNRSGLNQGTSGNVSVRCDEGILITPSSVPFESLTGDDLVAIGLDGSCLSTNQVSVSHRRPYSEWRMHTDILRERPEMNAVLHCHSVHATALACHKRDIPSFHYMVSAAGGDNIRCSTYATFGTCLLYTSPSPRDLSTSRMPSSA